VKRIDLRWNLTPDYQQEKELLMDVLRPLWAR